MIKIKTKLIIFARRKQKINDKKCDLKKDIFIYILKTQLMILINYKVGQILIPTALKFKILLNLFKFFNYFFQILREIIKK